MSDIDILPVFKADVVQNIREAKTLDDALESMNGMAANGWLRLWDKATHADGSSYRDKLPPTDTIQVDRAEYEKLKLDAELLDWLIKNKHLDAWWSIGGVADREQNIRDDIYAAIKHEGGA